MWPGQMGMDDIVSVPPDEPQHIEVRCDGLLSLHFNRMDLDAMLGQLLGYPAMGRANHLDLVSKASEHDGEGECMALCTRGRRTGYDLKNAQRSCPDGRRRP